MDVTFDAISRVFIMVKPTAILGKNVAQIRRDRNMSQYALAHKLGVSAASVNRIESGKSWVSEKTLERLIDILETDLSSLFRMDQSKPVKSVPRSKISLHEAIEIVNQHIDSVVIKPKKKREPKIETKDQTRE